MNARQLWPPLIRRKQMPPQGMRTEDYHCRSYPYLQRSADAIIGSKTTSTWMYILALCSVRLFIPFDMHEEALTLAAAVAVRRD